MAATISWTDLEDLVEALRRENPRVDPRALDDNELNALVEALPGFEPGDRKGGPGDFEAMRAMWHWGA